MNLRDAAAWLIVLACGIGIAGLGALVRVAAGEVAGREDRRAALLLAGGMAVVAFLGFAVLGRPAGNPVGGPWLLLVSLGSAAVSAAATFLAATLGYVLFARLRPLGLAFAAELALPVLLGATVLTAQSWQTSADIAHANWIHVSVAVTEPGTIVAGTVTGTVRLAVTVRTDEGYLVSEPSSGRPYPIFRIAAEGDPTPVPCGIEVNAPHGGPTTYERGGEYRYDVAFLVPEDADESCRFATGPWWLDFLLRGSRAETPTVAEPWIQQVRFELAGPRASS
jgi:hypothetical protein